jgi:hypothetical protein
LRAENKIEDEILIEGFHNWKLSENPSAYWMAHSEWISSSLLKANEIAGFPVAHSRDNFKLLSPSNRGGTRLSEPNLLSPPATLVAAGIYLGTYKHHSCRI